MKKANGIPQSAASIDYDRIIHCLFFAPWGYHVIEDEAIDWGARGLLWGGPGCLAADSRISYESRGPDGEKRSGKGGSIERLYQVFHGLTGPGKGRYQKAPSDSEFFASSIDDEDRVFKNRITDVVHSGLKECFRITTALGFELEATADHKFFDGVRYTRLGNLKVGESVFVHNNTARSKTGDKETEGRRRFINVKHHPIAGTQRIRARISRTEAIFKTYTYKRLARARAVMEAHINHLPFEEYVGRLNDGLLEGLVFLRRNQNVHHKDEDFTNDALGNLEVVDHIEHAREHSRERPIYFVAEPDTIVSIESVGLKDTFDLCMEAPFHNFVADGFVVHNSAKTAMVRRFCKRWGVKLYSLKPGARGEGAFGVIPVPNTAKRVLEYFAPDWVLQFEEVDYGLLFLDEMSCAGPAIQSPLLGLLEEKEIGAANMGPRIRVIGAANEVWDAAGGYELAASAANRLVHIPWPDPDEDLWARGLLTEFRVKREQQLDVLAEERRVMKEWPRHWGWAASIVGRFTLAKRGTMHRQQPDENDPQRGKAWLSPRSKERATRLLACSRIHGLADAETDLLVAGCCGDGFTTELRSYMRYLDLPDALDFLDGKVRFTHNPARIDRTAALVDACAAAVAPAGSERRDERARAFWQWLEVVSNDAADVVGMAIEDVLFESGLCSSVEANRVMQQVQPVLKATDRRKQGRPTQ